MDKINITPQTPKKHTNELMLYCFLHLFTFYIFYLKNQFLKKLIFIYLIII